jgi:hypothetical protein
VASLVTANPASAQEKPLYVQKLGSHSIGSEVTGIRRLSSACARSPGDCSFVDLQTGVGYKFLHSLGTTSAVAHASTAKAALPFGLKFGESLASARAKLPRLQHGWKTRSERQTVWHSSGLEFATTRGATLGEFYIELGFVSDRLTIVEYNIGTI